MEAIKSQIKNLTRSYTIFYTSNKGKEKKINIEDSNPFHAKWIAFSQHNIPLKSITRVV